MRISNGDAEVYADLVAADGAQRVVALSMAGAKTAVRAIYASLRANHTPWLKVYDDDGAEPVAMVRGGDNYSTEAKMLPGIKGVHMVVWLHDERGPAGYVIVPAGLPAGGSLAVGLANDPQMALPVVVEWAVARETGERVRGGFEALADAEAWLAESITSGKLEPSDPEAYRLEVPGWGDYLLERGLKTLSDFPEAVLKTYPEAPERLVEPLDVLGRQGITAYAYARDFDTWLGVLDAGLKQGQIGMEVGA